MAVLLEGRAGEVYNIGADAEMENIAVVELILETLGKPHDLISYVKDRLGHDRRYAIESAKIRSELGWEPCTRRARVSARPSTGISRIVIGGRTFCRSL